MVSDLRSYIEDLARRHREVHHRTDQPHFVDLNEDNRNTQLAQRMNYPGVFFESSGYSLRGEGANILKYANVRIEVWEHVTDTADYAQIETKLEKCEQILTDFFAKMLLDRRDRTQRFLLGLSLDGVEVTDIMNEQNALYGVRATLSVPESECLDVIAERFRDDGTFDNTFDMTLD